MRKILAEIAKLLTMQERKEAMILLAMVVFMAFLELSGVALIAPFMSLILKTDITTQSEFVQLAYHGLGFQKYENFMLFYGLVLVATIWGSGLFKSYTMYRLYDFTYAKDYSLSTRLFKTYLSQPYEFFLQRNSSDLSKNILSEVSVVVVGIMVTGMQVLAKLCIVVAILLFLLFINPMVVLVVGGIFLSVYLSIYFFFHKKLQEMGEKRHKLVEVRYNDVKESLMAIKETKIYDYESYFVGSYARNSAAASRFSAYRDTIAQTPSYLVEAVGFTLLIAALLYILGKGGVDMNSIIPILSTYAFAGYKLLPNIQQVFSGIARIKFTLPTLHNLVREFSLMAPSAADSVKKLPPPVQKDRGVAFSNVSFRYQGAAADALCDVDFTLEAGNFIGVVGRTGAGKTTLIDLFLGLLHPTQGKIYSTDADNTDSLDFATWKNGLSYVSQNVCLFNDTIRQNICMVENGHPPDDEKIWDILEAVDLAALVKSLPDKLDHVIGENGNRLSGGQRQRLSIARALYRDAGILVLDEATSALDKQTEQKILLRIKAIGKMVVMITHRLEHLPICDSIVYLPGNGRADIGRYEDIKRKYPQFAEMVASQTTE